MVQFTRTASFHPLSTWHAARSMLGAAVLAVVAAPAVFGQITIATVTIGNPGNAPDPRVMSDGTSGYGAVAYTYNIGTYEVTNAEYAAFLRAKAASDPFDLYNPGMAGPFGGITRSGSPGSYTYTAVRGRASNPVNFVSFWDACRFANWLHNGQGNGDTETGAYTLGGVANPVNTSVTRNAGWRWAVTSEDEWYKAAFHQPWLEMGDLDDYWLYPTSSNSVPTTAQANYGFVIGDTTPVSSYAVNYYGTFDMGGNVWEWNEATPPFQGSDSYRGARGGSFDGPVGSLQADTRSGAFAVAEDDSFGFRVSQAFPPPPPCPGDTNGDNQVNGADLSVLLGQFGQSVTPGTGADFNGDGVVNAADLSILLANFGSSC